MSESVIYSHFVAHTAQAVVPNVLAKRIRYFIAAPPGGSQPPVVSSLAQARVRFHALPDYFAFAWLRTVCNSPAKTRRMAHGAEGCRFGCEAVGGDDMFH